MKAVVLSSYARKKKKKEEIVFVLGIETPELNLASIKQRKNLWFDWENMYMTGNKNSKFFYNVLGTILNLLYAIVSMREFS